MEAQPKIGQANETGLDELLEKYGFKIGEDFVLDRQNVPGPVDVGGRKMLANLPVFVGVKTEQTRQGHLDPGRRERRRLPVRQLRRSWSARWPAARRRRPAPSSGRWRSTRPSAWKQTRVLLLRADGEDRGGQGSKDRGVFGLAYAYQGPLKSAYPPPARRAGHVGARPANTPPSESKKPVRLMVVGDSDFASDEYLQLGALPPLLLRAARRCCSTPSAGRLEDEALTPVRTKTVAARPDQVDRTERSLALKLVNILGVPLAFIAFGVVRWRSAERAAKVRSY